MEGSYKNQFLYNWVLHYLQVVNYPMANDWLKVAIYGRTETQSLPIHLLRVSARELHNSMVITPEGGGLK